MGVNLLDNYVSVENSTHIDTTFWTQNKPMNNDPKFWKRFVGHPMYTNEDSVQVCVSDWLIHYANITLSSLSEVYKIFFGQWKMPK
jgi:hypothetical protein